MSLNIDPKGFKKEKSYILETDGSVIHPYSYKGQFFHGRQVFGHGHQYSEKTTVLNENNPDLSNWLALLINLNMHAQKMDERKARTQAVESLTHLVRVLASQNTESEESSYEDHKMGSKSSVLKLTF